MKNKILRGFAWFFGLLFLISGIVSFSEEGFVAGTLMTLGALLLLPPVKAAIIGRRPSIKPFLLTLAGIILIVLSAMAFSPVEPIENDPVIAERKEASEPITVAEVKPEPEPMVEEQQLVAPEPVAEPEPIAAVAEPTDAEIGELMCSNLSKAANAIMSARQSGKPMSEVMAITNTLETEAAKVLMRAFVQDAFTVPLQSTAKQKAVAVSEFSNYAYLECSKVFMK